MLQKTRLVLALAPGGPAREEGADTCCAADVANPPPSKPGSRRRRLWELDGHIHCPVVGACLPIAALRRLIDRKLGGQALATDYALHCGTITECKRRTPIAEAVHRELDRRYAPALRQAAQARTTQALAGWWLQASAGPDLPGAFWATLTHARCTTVPEHQVLGEVHMLQHQVGTAQRVDQARLNAVVEENTALQAELAALHQRHRQQAAEQASQAERLQTDLVHARAEVIGLECTIGTLREKLRELESSIPELKSRAELAQQNQRQNDRIANLERALSLARQGVGRSRHPLENGAAVAEAGMDACEPVPAQDDASTATPATPSFSDRAVLRVGGRAASVPLYRHIVERTGGRFLHHDGGEEHSVARLDATLAAADLVICQTGCLSHNAYWRVKDHCKRTGKQCVYVDKPGVSGFLRGLAAGTAAEVKEAGL